MGQQIGLVTLLVRDYDDAIGWFVDKLRFVVVEDTRLDNGKRWVRIAPEAGGEPQLLLARAATPDQQACVGNQAGGRVFLFLRTDNFLRDHAAMIAAGVTFLEAPRRENYGAVAVFADLYGNRWDLIGPA